MDENQTTEESDSSYTKNLVGAVILGCAIYGALEATNRLGHKVLAWNTRRKLAKATKTTEQ